MGYRVTLLEVGNWDSESEAFDKRRYLFSSESSMPEGVHLVGGASNKWHGRLGEFTQEDFRRAWGKRKWNLEKSDLTDNYIAVWKFLLDDSFLDFEEARRYLKLYEAEFPRSWKLRSYFFCDKLIFRKKVQELSEHPNFQLLIGCEVQYIDQQDNQVELTVLQSSNRFKLSANYAFVAAGTLSSTRIVNESLARIEGVSPIKKQYSGLMEHIEGPIGTIRITRRDLKEIDFLILNEKNQIDCPEIKVPLGIAIEMDGKADEDAMALTHQFEFRRDTFQLNSWGERPNSSRALTYRLQWALWRMLRFIERLRGIRRIIVWIKCEEIPSELSYLEIRDEIIDYQHRVSEETCKNAVKLINQFCLQLKSNFKLDLSLRNELLNEKLPLDLQNNFHPSGTLPMGSYEDGFVVSHNQTLHEMDRVYVVGSSVFPTSSNSNPTFTALALTDLVCSKFKIASSNSKLSS